MIITELQAETTYSVTVAAYTTKGDGARSKPKLITTTGAGNVTVTADKFLCKYTRWWYKTAFMLCKAVKLHPMRIKKAPCKHLCHWARKVWMQLIAVSLSAVTLTHWYDTAMFKALSNYRKCREKRKRRQKRIAQFSSFDGVMHTVEILKSIYITFRLRCNNDSPYL